MPQHLDDVGNFDITGEFDFRNAAFLIPLGSTLPTITRANGQLFYFNDGFYSRLYFTIDGQWYYKDAM